MKPFKTLFAGALIGLASISSAQAHGNLGWSISIGSPSYYAPPPVYYSAPPVVYHSSPVVYYRPAPTVVYSAPAHGYYRSHSYGRWGHDGWRGGDRCERPRRHWR